MGYMDNEIVFARSLTQSYSMEKRMAKSSLKEALDRGSSLPFFFVLCAEALVHVMNQAENREKITVMK